MQKLYTLTKLFLVLLITTQANAQSVFWFEDFDSGAAGRWNISGNEPTPAGIPGLLYGVNNNFDFFTINDANTPELSGPIATGVKIHAQGQFVRGRHYDCSAPSDLPNPFVNTGATNNSLHITAQAACAGLVYAGTPGYDDWNCVTVSGNDATLTQTEQWAAYQNNIDATGKCNIKLTADFFLGGSANGLEAHSTVLYSVDGGATWDVVQNNLASCAHTFAGTCNDWRRRTFQLPPAADNQPDLRIAFRWTEDGNTNNNTQDYALGASFNVDNVMLSACDKPEADFFADMKTACKNQTIALNASVGLNTGSYSNCTGILVDNCPITAYAWNIPGATFVNGTTTSDPNPEIQFAANGAYTVELTVSSCGGDSIVNKANYIVVADCPPSANFTADLFTACVEPTGKLDTILLTDLSTTPSTAITAWAWSFNPATVTFVSGTNAASQHPQVTFNSAGTYEVTLQVTSSEGVDVETKTAYIEAISCECGSGGSPGPGTLWSEDFDGNGGAGSNWGTLNQSVGFQGVNANQWYISNQEDGNAAGVCGSSGSADASLHLSASPTGFGDIGAAYDATAPGGFCGFSGTLFCDPTTNKRSQSQNINTTGWTALSVNFNYIENGQGTLDDCVFEYSINGGGSWIQLTNTAKTALCGGGQGLWTAFSMPLPATCENITNLRIAVRWQNNPDGVGTDPSFAIDDIFIDGTNGGGGGPSHTWEGNTNADWHTVSNWSAGTVPTSTDDVLVPSPADLVGTFMPTISAAAVAQNVCNFGTITMVGNNTLTIDVDLLNEGVMTTTNVNAGADVIFANLASTYRGSGTMFDVDVAVNSSDFTLLNNMTARSFLVGTAGIVDLSTFTLSINKNLTKTNGTLIALNGEIHLIDACPTCVDITSNADISLNANQTFGNVLLNKTAGVVTSLITAVNHTFDSPKTLEIQSGIWDANTHTVNGSGNLTMSGGEYQTAKCATVVPELTGVYALSAGQVTLDGVCDQTIRVAVAGGTATVFSEDYENPNIAAGTIIVGNIAGWTETGATHTFANKESSGLNVQTATLSETGGVFGTITETLTSPSINFGGATGNPQLTFDYEWVNLTGDVPSVQVLYKSALADPWTAGPTFTATGVNLNNTVPLAGASSDFYVGFRVFFNDVAIGAAGGECTIDNVVVTGDGSGGSVDYYNVEFTGTNVKDLDNGNLSIQNQLFLNLPTGLGNYVNTGTDTCYVYNSNTTAVARTGGHIVGYLGRDVNASDIYTFDVGSDNAGGDTYYEPIEITTNSLSGVSRLVAKFYDVVPNPTTVNNVTFLNPAGNRDTVRQVEQEGYWQVVSNSTLIGGNYQALVKPSSFWTFTKPWAQDYYCLLKQDAVAQPWDFINGGLRTNDSTTTGFSDFSNFALAFADTNIVPPIILQISLLRFEGETIDAGNLLKWTTMEEIDHDYFELERSGDGLYWSPIATVDGIGNSTTLQDYQRIDQQPINGWNYYRLKSFDIYGDYEYSNVIVLYNGKQETVLKLFPNPATDVVSFDYQGADVNAEFSVNIIDVNGRKIFERSYAIKEAQVQETISTQDFPSGVYFVQFNNGNIRKSRKLIVVD